MECLGYTQFNADKHQLGQTEEGEALSTLFERLLSDGAERAAAEAGSGGIFTPSYVIKRSEGLPIDMTVLSSPQKVGAFMKGRVLNRPVSAHGGVWVMHKHKHGETYYVILPRAIPYDAARIVVDRTHEPPTTPEQERAAVQEMVERIRRQKEGKNAQA